MLDLYFGLACIVTLSAGLFWVAHQLAVRLAPVAFHVVAALAVSQIFVWLYWLQESPFVSQLLPYSNLIVVGNWLPLITAFLSGLAWQRVRVQWRKYVSVGALCSTCLYVSYSDLFQTPPAVENLWKDGVALQTRHFTCGPAAAATLLHAQGLETSEAEMARLCLTSPAGTLLYGLFRGLKIKTRGTDWDVQLFSGDLKKLRELDGPSIIQVGLLDQKESDARYERDWGWIRGVSHVVVLFGFDAQARPEIGDPSVGREYWNLEALQTLWQGKGLRLVRRAR